MAREPEVPRGQRAGRRVQRRPQTGDVKRVERREPREPVAAPPKRPSGNRRVPRKVTKEGPSVGERLRGFWPATRAVLRRHERLGTFVLRTVVVLGVAGLAVVAGRELDRYLRTSKAFAIETIDVKGLTRIERGELLEAAGIDVGSNVFAKSPEEIRASLLAHEWVKSAAVTRRLPGQIQIAISEREPLALLVIEPCPESAANDDSGECDEGSSLHLVSDEGRVFKRHDAADPVDLPVITGVDRERYGSDPEFAREVLLEAVALLHAYRTEGLAKRLPIGEIHIDGSSAFSLYVGDELTLVRLGVSPFAAKLRRMKKVFDQLERESARAEYVYLDNEERPDRVAVRLR